MNGNKAFLEAQELHKTGRIAEAERRYRKLLKKQPRNPEICFYLGLALLQTGKGADAVEPLQVVANAAPRDPMVQDHLGQALLAAGRHKEAIDRHKQAKALLPQRPEILFNLGVAMEQSGQRAEAEAEYRAVLTLAPGFFPAIANLGSILLMQGRYREAEPLLTKACQINPAAQEPLANLAYLHFQLDRPAEADEALKKLLQIAPEHPVATLFAARRQAREGKNEEAAESFRRALSSALPPRFVGEAWFELGKILDSEKRFGEAFQAFEAMNETYASLAETCHIDKGAFPRKIEVIRNWYPGPPSIASPPAGAAPRAPLFFVGFPRSGTTLMEQIMGAHPMTETTNEESPLGAAFRDAEALTGRPWPQCLAELSEEQRSEVRQKFFARAGKVTGCDLSQKLLVDKLPLNIATVCLTPWIFPDARVVVAIRDPRDACLSCFMQRFALNDGMIHFLSLESTVRFYAQVMEFWLEMRDRMDIPWMEYRYEDLVSDFEATTGRVIDFMGLPWDENVARYREEARKKEIRTPSRDAVTREINSRAVSRWRNYAERFEPFQETLAPFVRAFGYEDS